ncbi:MAG TPA: recombination protein O N-terminal domain-containing protein [Candidatus Paceibacterota bacterium]|nr:recombination protein O N-terminal domain-containing protein [Candidatus Paceibacterota bacterium]
MHIEGIVIRKERRREHDQHVVLYTRQAGKLSVLAKSSLKNTSHQRAALDDGNLVRAELVPSRSGAFILTSAQAQSCWHTAKAAPQAWAAAQFFLEAVDVLVFDNQTDELLWDALTGALAALDGAADVMPTFRRCQGALLEALGYGTSPNPDEVFEQIAQRKFKSLELLYGLIGTADPWYRMR